MHSRCCLELYKRNTCLLAAGALLIGLVQGGPLTSASVDTFAQSLVGSVLSYNVSGEPKENMSPAFGLWSKLEVRSLYLSLDAAYQSKAT